MQQAIAPLLRLAGNVAGPVHAADTRI